MSQADDKDMMAQAKAEEESLERFKCLFDGLQFFLSREVPREAVTFIIRWGYLVSKPFRESVVVLYSCVCM